MKPWAAGWCPARTPLPAAPGQGCVQRSLLPPQGEPHHGGTRGRQVREQLPGETEPRVPGLDWAESELGRKPGLSPRGPHARSLTSMHPSTHHSSNPCVPCLAQAQREPPRTEDTRCGPAQVEAVWTGLAVGVQRLPGPGGCQRLSVGLRVTAGRWASSFPSRWCPLCEVVPLLGLVQALSP